MKEEKSIELEVKKVCLEITSKYAGNDRALIELTKQLFALFDFSMKPILDLELFEKIDRQLGEVTDFDLKKTSKGIELHYKSNGIPKIIYQNSDDMKAFVQSFIYCSNSFSHKPVLG
jgi:hypothetical protein